MIKSENLRSHGKSLCQNKMKITTINSISSFVRPLPKLVVHQYFVFYFQSYPFLDNFSSFFKHLKDIIFVSKVKWRQKHLLCTRTLRTYLTMHRQPTQPSDKILYQVRLEPRTSRIRHECSTN